MASMISRCHQGEIRFVIALLFTVGLLSRIGLSIIFKEYQNPIAFEQRTIALAMVEGHGYANTYAIPTGPTAHSPPLYTLILAGVFRIFGTGEDGHFARHVLNAIPASAAFALLPLVAQVLMLPVATGVIAGLVGNLAPIHIHTELNAGEPAFSALVLICLLLLTASLWQENKLTCGKGAFHGFIWGMALLLNPALLTVCVAWMLYAFSRFRFRAISYVAGLAAAAFITLLPWAIRNALVFGSPIFFRSNFGLELQMGNNELARPMSFEMMKPGGAFEKFHPTTNQSEAEQVLHLGEVEYNRRKLHDALNWIRQNPSDFILLTLARMVLFWFPKTLTAGQSVAIWIITGLAIGGLIMAPLRGHIGAIWILYPSIYYLTQIDNRYRYVILWTMILFAVFAVQCIAAKLSGRTSVVFSQIKSEK